MGGIRKRRRLLTIWFFALGFALSVATAACSNSTENGPRAAIPAASSEESKPPDGSEVCDAYVIVVTAISESVSEALTTTAELSDVLSDPDTLLAMLLDEDLTNDIIRTYDGYADDFAAYQRAMPTSPSSFAETDRYLRTALSLYESAYGDMASALRMFRENEINEATELLGDAAATVNQATEEIVDATEAIPSGGC
jgi:hypothetical protein